MEDVHKMEEWKCCVSCRREIKDEPPTRCHSCGKEDPEVVMQVRSTTWKKYKDIFQDPDMMTFVAEDTENIEDQVDPALFDEDIALSTCDSGDQPILTNEQKNGNQENLLERGGHTSTLVASRMQVESQSNSQAQQVKVLPPPITEHHGTGQSSQACWTSSLMPTMNAQIDNQGNEGDGNHSSEGTQAASSPLHLPAEKAIEDYDVVLGHPLTPTTATKWWRKLRQQYAKKKISKETLDNLKTELRKKLDSEMDQPLPHDPIFWYSTNNLRKLIDPKSTDKRILKGDASGTKYGKATDNAIKDDVRSAPRQSRTKKVFNFKGSPGSVLGQAETKLEAWIGEDPAKTAVVQSHGGLSRLVQRFNEYTAKKQQCEQEALSHLNKLVCQAELEQIEKRFASEATNLANEMVDCYRCVKLKLEGSSQSRRCGG